MLQPCLLLLLVIHFVSLAAASPPSLPSIKSVQGHRLHMEDELSFASLASHSGRTTFAAVFDGHGGGEVSKYLRSNYLSKFLQLLSPDEDWTSPDRVKEAMR